MAAMSATEPASMRKASPIREAELARADLGRSARLRAAMARRVMPEHGGADGRDEEKLEERLDQLHERRAPRTCARSR